MFSEADTSFFVFNASVQSSICPKTENGTSLYTTDGLVSNIDRKTKTT